MKYVKNCWCLLALVACCLISCSTNRKLSSKNEIELTSIESSELKKKYSTLLNIPEQQITSMQLYALIDEWYGTEYKYGGCDKNGIDCSNFVGMLYQQIYSRSLTGSSTSIFNQCKIISKNELQEGDLVFFKIDKNTVSHIGMYLQNNKFVHATTKKGVMIDDLDEPYYTKYFYKAGRLK